VVSASDHWGVRAAISWPLAMAALVVALAAPEESATAGWTVLILAIVVEIAGGWPFLRTTAPGCSATVPPAWTRSSPSGRWRRWR
jgi:cation transport ATPase